MKSIPPEFLPQWASLVASLKPAPSFQLLRGDSEPVGEPFRTENDALEALDAMPDGHHCEVYPVSIELTVGFTPGESVTGGDDDSASWSYQTGDNSFSGGAYGHPVWGVVWISADSDPDEVAQEIAADIESQLD